MVEFGRNVFDSIFELILEFNRKYIWLIFSTTLAKLFKYLINSLKSLI